MPLIPCKTPAFLRVCGWEQLLSLLLWGMTAEKDSVMKPGTRKNRRQAQGSGNKEETTSTQLPCYQGRLPSPSGWASVVPLAATVPEHGPEK